MEPITGYALAAGASTLGNIFGNWYQSGKNREAMEYQEQQMRLANARRQEAINKLIEYYGGSENLQREYAKYKAEVEAFDPSVEMPEFIFDTDVGRYLDPSIQYQMDVANRNLQQNLQGRGGLYSGKAMKALQEQSQKFAQTDYGNAYDRMTQDRQFSYQDYLNRFENTRANKASQFEKLTGLLTNAGANRDTIASLMGQGANLEANMIDAQGANRARFIQGEGDMWGGTIRNIFSPRNAGAVTDFLSQPKSAYQKALDGQGGVEYPELPSMDSWDMPTPTQNAGSVTPGAPSVSNQRWFEEPLPFNYEPQLRLRDSFRVEGL